MARLKGLLASCIHHCWHGKKFQQHRIDIFCVAHARIIDAVAKVCKLFNS